MMIEKQLVSDNPSQAKVLDKISDLVKQWQQKAAVLEIAKAREIAIAKDTNEKHKLTKELATIIESGTGKILIDEIRKEFAEFINTEEDLTKQRYATASQTTLNVRKTSLFLMIFSIILGSIISVLTIRAIVDSVTRLMKSTEIIGSGNFEHRVEITSKDEIGQLSTSFNQMADSLSDAYRIIKEMSVTDELTKTYNRRHFNTRLDEEIERSGRYRHPLSLLLLDIDHFKRFNDIHGHQVGDDVLIGVASVLKSDARKTDVVARYGGEEFVIILPDTDESNAYVAAEKLRKFIEKNEFNISDGKNLTITASFGVSSLNMIAENVADKSREILKLADDAMYRAKESGRNTVVLFSNQQAENI